MAKVGIVGLKEDRELLLSVLHDLRVIEVEPIGPEALQFLGPEHGSERQRAVGDTLIRLKGLVNALPPVPVPSPRTYKDLDDVLAAARTIPIDGEVGELKREEDRLTSERTTLDDQAELLEKFSFYRDRLEWLSARHLLAFFGEADLDDFERLRTVLPPEQGSILVRATGDRIRFLVAVRRENADALVRLAQETHADLAQVPELSGTIAEELPRLGARIAAIDTRLAAIRQRLGEISAAWFPTLSSLEEALAIENRKFELWNRFGAGVRTFALEGWIAKRDRPRLEAAIERAVGGRAALYDRSTNETPPTFMENPRGVRFYEFFIRFYSLPDAGEWDPTWIFAIAFPIFFGLMLGDAGYGLVILLVSLWMLAGFPGRTRLPKSIKNFVKLIMPPSAMRQLAWTLLPASAIAIGLGAVFNTFFGFPFLPGPALLDPTSTRGLPKLLLLSGYIGLTMVTVGFVLGALKEYFHHHYRGALAKVGGIAFAWGIATIGLMMLRGQTYWPPTAGPWVTLGFALLGSGAVLLLFEGFQGIMGLIEIVSHILSYTRLVGILLASVILAFVIDHVAVADFQSGSVVFFVLGLFILVVGQIFNLILGVFEPGIQGARLIFVEQFSKFYSGNGRPFRPLGSVRRHTLSPFAGSSQGGAAAPVHSSTPPPVGAPTP
ncbi:MAG: V-type ATP synthase subunit I [Thermoplasmata archaeon]|nr:V-type ATP synthase subunit I [Thermoplasmata archaeon]